MAEILEENVAELVGRAKTGDSQAFALIYDTFIKKIYDFIFYKTMHQQLAEDLTSQTFLKAWKKISQFQKGNFSAWLYTIARNIVVDHYRSQKEILTVEDFWELKADDNVFEEVEKRLKIEKLREGLSHLKASEREILMLRLWQDLPFKEIAIILDKNEGATKMSFARAMESLKKEMPVELFVLLPFILNLWKKFN
ncbi:MAG: RNA polymerase sigma factor [Patescibacteria group bacterium]|jgi:RNA polymerase sigma-70 factor (ECF subfamily)|nr:RNA polymerase sigma factor [Patescibacteria group bacterium]